MNNQYVQNLKLTIYTEKRINEQKDAQLYNLQYKYDKVKDVLEEKEENAHLKQQNKVDEMNDNSTQYSKNSQQENNMEINSTNDENKTKLTQQQFFYLSNDKKQQQNVYFTPNKKDQIYKNDNTNFKERQVSTTITKDKDNCQRVLNYSNNTDINNKSENFIDNIYVIGITENDFRIYQKIQQPIQPRFLYTSQNHNSQEDNTRIQYLLSDQIEPFIIELEKNQKVIQSLLLDQKNFFNQFQFYCINLNSEKLIEKNCKKSKILQETNVSDSEYYYCLKTFDFFIDQKQDKKISFYFFEKMYVIKTLFPVTEIHYDILKKIFSHQRQHNIQSFQNKDIINYLQQNDYQKSLQNQIKIISSFVYEKTELCDQNIGNDFITISINKKVEKYLLPEIKFRSFACSRIFNNILSKISFESFLFIWLSLVHENSIVFIGQNKFDTTGAIQIFTSLLYPFKWTYPILSNLTEQCYSFLSSPVPLLAGINKPPQFILNNLIPQHAQKLGSNNIYYFMDFDVIYCKSNDLESLTIPNYYDQIKKLKKIYRKINKKKNQYIEIIKQDQVKKFQRKNFQAYKNQIINLGQKEFSIQNNFMTNVPINLNYDPLFLFIKMFYGQFILSTFPLSQVEIQQINKGESENVAITYYPDNEQDRKFYKKIIESQGFSYYLSSNQISQ